MVSVYVMIPENIIAGILDLETRCPIEIFQNQRNMAEGDQIMAARVTYECHQQ